MSSSLPQHTDVAVIGAGFSGIAMARALAQSGRNFVVLEKGNDVGGTWRDNTYPGIACDVPSNLYSFSFALNPNWSRSYSGGREINDYIRATARKLDLLKFIRFNTTVTGAEWSEAEQHWKVSTSEGEFTSKYVIGAMGPLSEPQIPELPGIENFTGETFHSARWDHSYDLEGKRIAVVGTGASAIQFVPEIQPLVKELHLFQRTPPWILPRSARKLSKFEHKLFRFLPFTQKLVRASVYTSLEFRVIAFVKHAKLMRFAQPLAKANIRRHIKDKELRKKVTPNFLFGCKRVLMANDYYPALAKENVEVITDGVAEVRANSVVTSDGIEREVDAIIWGTGFHVTENPQWNNLVGRDGRTLAETWSERGMESYLGTLIPNFPNLFEIIGPNTGLGHSSMVYMIESNIEFIMSTLDFVDGAGVGSAEVTREAVDEFEADVNSRMVGTVWTSGGCSSWYLDSHGRNTTLWPDFTFRYRKKCREFDPAVLTLRSAPVAERETIGV